MSAPPVLESPPLRVWPMYRALVGIGLLCGLLIVTVFEATRPVIERNRAEALRHAIFEVLPGAESVATFRALGDDGFEPLSGPPAGAHLVHAGFGADGHLVGVALEASGMGYQDVVRLIYGYSFEQQAVIGMRVLESRETPGLGDRIESDPVFLANFENLDVSLDPEEKRILHPIEGVKSGAKEHPWQIDGITGATISSSAIADMLRRSTTAWVARIHRHRADFRSGV